VALDEEKTDIGASSVDHRGNSGASVLVSIGECSQIDDWKKDIPKLLLEILRHTQEGLRIN
jgi:hypothetical protein